MNVLLVTLDQFRGDCLSAAGHPVVRTPNLDRLAADGVRLARHYSQAAPCGPGRACLYTGHVPAQQPRGRQRDARSTTASTTWPGRPGGPGTPRPCSATPTRAIDPREADRARRPPAVDLSGVPAGLRRRARLARRAGCRGGRGSGTSATTSPPTATPPWPPSPSGPAEHGVSAFLSDAAHRLAASARTGPGSRTPATGARTRPTRPPGTGPRAYDPDDAPTGPRATRACRMPFCGRLAGLRAARRRARARGRCRRSTSA